MHHLGSISAGRTSAAFVVALLGLLVLQGCGEEEVIRSCSDDELSTAITESYARLLDKHPVEALGFGPEPVFDGSRDLPMAYALILTAEANRFRACPSTTSSRRIRKSLRWLVRNADLDRDGIVGWGIPHPWDAFADGTVNPESSPYTITTAMVGVALLDAVELSRDFPEADLSRSDVARAQELTVEVWKRWSDRLWTPDASGDYFAYSPAASDDRFVHNAHAMFVRFGARLFRQPWVLADRKLMSDIESKVEIGARSLIDNAILVEGRPHWTYLGLPDPADNPRLDDLLHHVYTSYSLEIVRDASVGDVELPWTRESAMTSLLDYYREGSVYEYPQAGVDPGLDADRAEVPARLWAVGTFLAFACRWGQSPAELATAVVDSIDPAYGSWPELRLQPEPYWTDGTYYPRIGAHLLWGLSECLAAAGPSGAETGSVFGRPTPPGRFDAAWTLARSEIDDTLSDAEKSVALARWVVRNTTNARWVPDEALPGSDVDVQARQRSLPPFHGLCSTRAKLFVHLAKKAGLEASVFNIYNFGGPGGGHSCAQVRYDDKWRFFDVTYAGYFERDGEILSFDDVRGDPAAAIGDMVVIGKTTYRDYDPGGRVIDEDERMRSVYTVEALADAHSAGFPGSGYPVPLTVTFDVAKLPLELGERGKPNVLDDHGAAAGVSEQMMSMLSGYTDNFRPTFVFENARPGDVYEVQLEGHRGLEGKGRLEAAAVDGSVSFLSDPVFAIDDAMLVDGSYPWRLRFVTETADARFAIRRSPEEASTGMILQRVIVRRL